MCNDKQAGILGSKSVFDAFCQASVFIKLSTWNRTKIASYAFLIEDLTILNANRVKIQIERPSRQRGFSFTHIEPSRRSNSYLKVIRIAQNDVSKTISNFNRVKMQMKRPFRPRNFSLLILSPTRGPTGSNSYLKLITYAHIEVPRS